MRISRCIYVYFFNRIRFHAEVSTKLKKMHFLRQFKDHNSGTKHGNQTNDPIFFIYFSRSNCFQHSFLYLKKAKVYFHGVFYRPECIFWCILVCKIPHCKSYRFGKTIIRFQKVNNMTLLKIHGMLCPPRGAKKRYHLMGYIQYPVKHLRSSLL